MARDYSYQSMSESISLKQDQELCYNSTFSTQNVPFLSSSGSRALMSEHKTLK